MSEDEITVTLTTPSGQFQSLPLSSSNTTLKQLSEFAIAVLGLPQPSLRNQLVISKEGTTVFDNNNVVGDGRRSLKDAGIRNGDVLLVGIRPNGSSSSSSAAGASTTHQSSSSSSSSSAGGGLDFTELLQSANMSTTQTPTNRPTGNGGNGGGLTFNIPGLSRAIEETQRVEPSQPVRWDGMTLDDALRENQNPDLLVRVLLDSKRHGNLMKELNYHSPGLAKKLHGAEGMEDAARVWREEMMKGSINRAFHATMANRKESEMKSRLKVNPLDEEANKYFGDKIRQENVEAQYRQMMEEYPESMGRVLMLYISAEVNGHPIQAFVDSGAQNTIMSSQCAERCNILHLVDDRFEGSAVGVGTGKILGRVHSVSLKIRGGNEGGKGERDHFFPCSITVMDSEKGLGDKNMDFLFGLDMLKRHRCKIDLLNNTLVFSLGDGVGFEVPFLHEKDLPTSKGGTKGFDAEKANEEVAKRIAEAEKEDNSKEKDKDGEPMDTDEKK